MRVISGQAKGRKLKVPKLDRGRRIRPLTDQAREALFNILGALVDDCCFLDLFAGTGAVGIEALSRGAKIAIFVEHDRSVVSTIRENLALTGFSDCAEVYSLDAVRAIKLLSSKKGRFGIIFLGAPYESPALEKAMELLGVLDLLSEGGVVVAEHRAKHAIADVFGTLRNVRDASYGDTVLSFYKLRQEA
jgi:16S rRNA (guanine(966)-N(2))-methyltransferase RsmD